MMKLALGDAPPLVFVLLRLIGTIVLLAPALRAMRVPLLPIPGERLGLFWVGQLQVAAFLVFAILGLSIEAAGRAIVLAYTFSLWAIPIGLLLGVERLRRFHLIGTAIGFAGLVLFMNPALVDWTSARTLLGNAFLLLSAMTWALGSCLYRRRIWRTPFWTQTFWQLAVSTPVVLVFALPEAAGQAAGQTVNWSGGLVAILAYNCIVTTALGYFLWAVVLTAMPAAAAGQVLALTPVGGFLISTAIFGGAVTADVIVAIALIVAGIILTLRR
jgi:drug/metabolite transporter (DMT)-like permease